MSARESIENLWDRATPVGPLLDQYAHELAEKIRAVGVSHWEGMSDIARAIRDTRATCADLIDPQKEGQQC